MTESNNPALTQTPVESIPIPAIVPENLPSPAETPINEPATDPIPTQPKKRSWKKIIILALILASIVLFPVPVRGSEVCPMIYPPGKCTTNTTYKPFVLWLFSSGVLKPFLPKTLPNEPTSPVATPTPLPSEASAQEGATLNWKTYRHPDSLYSIKYPPTSQYLELDNKNGNCKKQFVLLDDKKRDLINYPLGDEQDIVGNIVIDICSSSKEVPNDLAVEGPPSSTVTLDGRQGLNAKGITDFSGVGYSLGYEVHVDRQVFDKDGLKFYIDFRYKLPSGGEITNANQEQLKIFDQILSTFKFTDNFKSCNADLLGIQTSIPRSWQCDIKDSPPEGEININADIFKIKISNLGRVVIAVIRDTKLFYQNKSFSLITYSQNGQVDEIYGILEKTNPDKPTWISITYKNKGAELTEEQKTQLTDFLNSIKISN